MAQNQKLEEMIEDELLRVHLGLIESQLSGAARLRIVR